MKNVTKKILIENLWEAYCLVKEHEMKRNIKKTSLLAIERVLIDTKMYEYNFVGWVVRIKKRD